MLSAPPRSRRIAIALACLVAVVAGDRLTARAEARGAVFASARRSPEWTLEANRAELARRHAPFYRFNAFVAGDRSPQNKSEDYFPQSVARFWDELASGRARVVVRESSGDAPGANEVRAIAETVRVEPDKIVGMPRAMAGDEPGAAPVYFHCYEDRARRVRHADGSGEDVVFVEYWLFYPQDEALLSICGATVRRGGHRGDWESITLELALARGAGGASGASEIRRAFFLGHGKKMRCELGDFERVDERGASDARGAHAVVYVSVGKHASYPEPGVWKTLYGVPGLGGLDEFFLGNGVSVRSWSGALVDLEGDATAEVAPPSFARLLGPALRARGLVDWRAFRGRWGPDRSPIVPMIGSPPGPRAHADYGGGDGFAESWSAAKRGAHRLKIGAVAPMDPPPLPRRL